MRFVYPVKYSFGGRRHHRSDTFLHELPQHLDVMAARIENGESVFAVLIVQSQYGGSFAKALRRLATRLQYGESIEAALELLEAECNSDAVSEFVNKVLLSIQRGTPLADQLHSLAVTVRGQQRVQLLRRAGGNELKMLIPLVFLILPTTVTFAIFPSLQLLQLGF